MYPPVDCAHKNLNNLATCVYLSVSSITHNVVGFDVIINRVLIVTVYLLWEKFIIILEIE